MSIFNVVYNSGNDARGMMEPTIVTYGEDTQLRKNVFKRDGYQFCGWKAYRLSDKKTCYVSPDNKRRFFAENEQPDGWKPYIYIDMCHVAKLSKVDNDVINMCAQWKVEQVKICNTNTSDENKEKYEQKLLNRPIVLLGESSYCRKFYKKYSERLNIRCILLDNKEELDIFKNDEVLVKEYAKKEIMPKDYVVICHEVKIRLDKAYRDSKKKLTSLGLITMRDFIRADVAEMILDKKKLWLWFGFCQADTLRKDIFAQLKSVTNRCVLTAFRYGLDTLEKSYKFDECKELVSLCDYLTYVPLVFAEGKMDFDFDTYLPLNAKKVALPRLPFRGYYPWRDSDIETFFKYSIDGKLHWPFAYQESIIDNLILEGKSDDEIYYELMREDIISEKEIKRNLKLAYKFIEISEKTADIKILDFIKENLTKRMLYRDGLHYQNFMYFEIARRIAIFLSMDCEDEIDELEEKVLENGKQFIDYTEVPVLPCIAKALELDFVTDETLWRVRFTEGGQWRGTQAKIKLMNRKDWIYTYVRYARACMTLKEFWEI